MSRSKTDAVVSKLPEKSLEKMIASKKIGTDQKSGAAKKEAYITKAEC